VKVLVIAPQPFFSPRGTPLSVYYRTLVTAEMGHAVDLLTYGQGVDVDLPGVRIVRIPSFHWLGQVKVGPSLLKAFLDVWIFCYALGMMAWNRYDVVHAHEEAVFFCRFLQPIFRYKLIYDLHSILSQQLTNFDFTRSKLLIGLFARLEEGCLAKADAVISISPALAEYAVTRVRDPRAHFLIENSLFDPLRLKAPAGGDQSAGAPTDGERSRRARGREPDAPAGRGDDPQWMSVLGGERPVILYAGTFESYQGIDLLLDAFALALQQGQQPAGGSPGADAAQRRADDDRRPFLLLLGGRPRQVDAARRRAQKLGIEDDCRFAGQVSRRLAQRATRAADVLTSPRTIGDNTPLKIYEQIASGVPLVATRIGSHTQVLSDDECVLVDPQPESMAAGLLRALRGGEDIERRIAGARRLYDEHYSPAAYRDKMKRLFDWVGG
jgi:glycosyltransferase involved in cell wall biosynthesis